ncbi:COX assembly mitochondrial protein homolog [Planococcus citri]|uniref:COX assembly mitochondrial protein homolog n=1 Tax=Planococcus citri TaxID=170843 RepID=UPI0031F90595
MGKYDFEEIVKAVQGKGYAGDRGTYNKGYHGLGDPDDKSLNEMELKIAIPSWETDIIHREYCNIENQEYQKCRDSSSFYKRFYVCSDQKLKLNNCTEHWKNKVDLREQATAEYLEERRLFRSTGLSKQEREAKTTRADTLVNKIRSYVLSEEDMKKYRENAEKHKVN